MFFVYYVIYLLSLPCSAINIEQVQSDINLAGIYKAEQIIPDHGEGFIALLIPSDKEGSLSLFDANVNKILEFIESIGNTHELVNAPICSLDYIHLAFFKKGLSNLLGFDIILDLENPENNRRYVPSINALNARLRLLKSKAQELSLPQANDISDIFFYSVMGNFSNVKLYLRLASLGGFPIASFADGGDGSGYHDQFHVLQLMLPKFLLDGYADYIKDTAAFIKFAKESGYKNNLGFINLIGRSIDGLANLLTRYKAAIVHAYPIAHIDGEFNHIQFDREFKKYLKSFQDDYYTQLDAIKNYTAKDAHFGKPYPKFFSGPAEIPNSFFPRVNDLITPSRARIAQPDRLLELLKDFRSSRYAHEHNLYNKLYHPKGIELYLLLDKHVHFMTLLSDYPEIQEALALPDF
jgi:hypothetical protein